MALLSSQNKILIRSLRINQSTTTFSIQTKRHQKDLQSLLVQSQDTNLLLKVLELVPDTFGLWMSITSDLCLSTSTVTAKQEKTMTSLTSSSKMPKISKRWTRRLIRSLKEMVLWALDLVATIVIHQEVEDASKVTSRNLFSHRWPNTKTKGIEKMEI